jgi:hypothetical protein
MGRNMRGVRKRQLFGAYRLSECGFCRRDKDPMVFRRTWPYNELAASTSRPQ